jgi:peptidoglycan/LPS O-acetylase OafA/YrhL
MGAPVDFTSSAASSSAAGHQRGPDGRFRPDLEGLRAVAVLLVLAYHAGVVGITGGYVGVDVFFVLSGFLITGLIYRELVTTGRVSLMNFYARRARRLLPAAGVVLLVTLVASVVILPSFRLPTVSGDVASAGLYVSNLRFGLQANDYFAGAADPSPVLHFWSLSVEEQFYIVWPTILAGLFLGLARGSSARPVLLGIAAIGILSLIGDIWLTDVNQPWAFYLLPTRAWELALGGLIAVAIGRISSLPGSVGGVATIVGLACIAIAALTFTDETLFPGTAAILPVVGAALVIVGGARTDAPLPSRVLAVGPMRYLGRISYSLYLWHWPILLFGGILLGPTFAIPLALLAIPVAAASQHWIEEPLRYGRFIGTRPGRNLLEAGAVGLVVVMASAAVLNLPGVKAPIVASAGDPSEFASDASNLPAAPGDAADPSSGPSGEPAAVDPRPCADCTLTQLTPPLGDLLVGRIPDANCDVTDRSDCLLGSKDPKAPLIALFGDSHAGNWTAVFSEISNARGLRFLHLTHAQCQSILSTVWSLSLKRVYTECTEWREKAIKRLEAEKPDLIVLTNSDHPVLADDAGHAVKFSIPPTDAWRNLWSRGFEAMLDRLTAIGSRVVVIGDPPVPSWAGLDPSTCIESRPNAFQSCVASREKSVPPAVHDMERTLAPQHGVAFVDPTPWFCDGDSCPAVVGRTIVYADSSGHLTAAFVRLLEARLLDALPFPQ